MNRLKKLIIVQVVLAVGLAGIYLLPKTYGMRDSAIVMSLPTFVGKWHGKPLEVSTLEEESLADDTQHEKKSYRRFSPTKIGDFEFLSAFIVLSGSDMNNSIHRPERCLPAQGLALEARNGVDIKLGDGQTLSAMRLKCSRMVNGRRIPNLTYYWFTGAKNLTNSHYMRTFIDMRDRILTGTNQRWAYVTVAADYQIQGIEGLAYLTEEEADKMIQNFIAEVFDDIHKTDEIDL